MPKKRKEKKPKPYAVYILDRRKCASPLLAHPSSHASQVAILLRIERAINIVFDCSNGMPRFRVTGKIGSDKKVEVKREEIERASLRFMPKVEVEVQEFSKGVKHP